MLMDGCHFGRKLKKKLYIQSLSAKCKGCVHSVASIACSMPTNLVIVKETKRTLPDEKNHYQHALSILTYSHEGAFN